MAADRMNRKGGEADADGTERTEVAATPPASGRFWRFTFRRWLLIPVVVLLSLIQGAAIAYYHRLHTESGPPPANPEVSLGKFHFDGDRTAEGRTGRAEFALHVALVEPADPAARQRLETHKFRVQQDLEELLRKAHDGDFDDPALRELKRQMQEQINQTLGMRAIAAVIITDLKLHAAGAAEPPMVTAAARVP